MTPKLIAYKYDITTNLNSWLKLFKKLNSTNRVSILFMYQNSEQGTHTEAVTSVIVITQR